jgi:Cu-Zn family superoxide dismutase
MKKIGLLFACVLVAGCGGGKRDTKEPVAQAPAPVEPAAVEPATYAPDEPTEAEAPTAEEEPAAPAEEDTTMAYAPPKQEPATVIATAELKAVKDDASMGTITFENAGDGTITITGEFTGLKKNGVHAIYIYENGDCSKKGKKIGKHLNPTKQKHGPPDSATRHAGDFGNLTADEAGNATFSMTTDSLSLDPNDIGRADTIVNRAVVIHTKKDTKKGNAGAPLACGVITLSQ